MMLLRIVFSLTFLYLLSATSSLKAQPPNASIHFDLQKISFRLGNDETPEGMPRKLWPAVSLCLTTTEMDARISSCQWREYRDIEEGRAEI
jgi:hypothetical protein